MATVYLARDLRHNRRVALKVLRPDLAAVLGSERFLSEIEVTANLQHPNLLPLFDILPNGKELVMFERQSAAATTGTPIVVRMDWARTLGRVQAADAP